MKPDISKDTGSSYIKIKQEWRPFNEACMHDPYESPEVKALSALKGERGKKFLYGEQGYYGCDTGCTVYRIYLAYHDQETEEEFICSEFSSDDAISQAEEYSSKHGNIPIVLLKEWDW